MFITLPDFKELCLFTLNVNLNIIDQMMIKLGKGCPTLISDTSFFLLIIPAPNVDACSCKSGIFFCLFSLGTGKLPHGQKERRQKKN